MNTTERAAYAAELAAHGYSDKQIEKELAYQDRVARQNAAIRSDKAWNYGFHNADA